MGEKHCSYICYEQALPKCTNCGKRMEEWISGDNECKFCTLTCFEDYFDELDEDDSDQEVDSIETTSSKLNGLVNNVQNIASRVSEADDRYYQKVDREREKLHRKFSRMSDKDLIEFLKNKNNREIERKFAYIEARGRGLT